MRWLAAHAGPFQAVALIASVVCFIVAFHTGLHDGLALLGFISGAVFVGLCNLEEERRWER